MKAIITTLKKVRPHENADRLKMATVLGNDIVVGLESKEGDVGIFFDVDTQLSPDFCKYNNLYSNSDLNENSEKKGYFSHKRRVKAQRFRGEKSEGYFVPIEYLAYTYGEGYVMTGEEDIYDLKIGEEFNSWNDQEICKKYIIKYQNVGGSINSKGKYDDFEGFERHFDTNQLYRNSFELDSKSDIYITEKLHGTSGRVARLPRPNKGWILSRLISWFISLMSLERSKSYVYVAGSRKREFILNDNSKEGNLWEFVGYDFIGKLLKGETLYYEIVGYDPSGSHTRYNSEGVSTIMNTLNNAKLKAFLTREEYNKFISSYGEMTEFSYNLEKGECKVYLYRITMLGDDGTTREMPFEYVMSRAKELEIDHVPLLNRIPKGLIEDIHHEDRDELVTNIAQSLTDSKSEIFRDHVKEGVVVHQYNNFKKPVFLKNKSFIFKVLEGIIKEDSSAPDMEEAEQQL